MNSRYTLTPYLRPCDPQRGQVVVMPNQLDSWVMGWLSLVFGWSIICLITQDRRQIIELLTGLSESHLSCDSGRAQLKSYQICLEAWDPDESGYKTLSFYLLDRFIWCPDLWLKNFFFFFCFTLWRCTLSLPAPVKEDKKKKKEHPKDHISNHQAVFIHVSLLDTCQQPSEKCWHRCPPVRQPRSLCVNLDLAQGYSHPANVM